MKRLLLLIAMILSVNSRTLYAQTQTTVTGSIQTPTGVAATTGYIEFRLRPNSSTVAYRVTGTAAIAPQTSRCRINASGQVVGPTGTGSCSVWGNTTLLPANSCYDVAIAPGNVQANLVQNQLIAGSSYDLSNPQFCPQVTLVPQYQSITTAPINANLVPAANKVFTLGDNQHYYGQAYIDSLNVNSFSQVANLNNRMFCASGGGTVNAKYATAAALLPSTGGIVDCSNLQGVQTITADTWSSVTVPVLFIPPVGPITVSDNVTIPATVTWQFPQGSIVSIASGKILTFNGGIQGTLSQHFTGSGTVSVVSAHNTEIYPEWWGAVRDGTTDDTAAIQKTVLAYGSSGSVRFSPGNYGVGSTALVVGSGISLKCSPTGDATFFRPTAAMTGSVIKFQATGAFTVAYSEITDCGFDGGSNTHAKTAIEVVDGEEVKVQRNHVAAWTDGTHASIGLSIAGRQKLLVSENNLFADLPMVIKVDPNVSVVQLDSSDFHDNYMIVTPGVNNPNVTINTGVFMTNVSFCHENWVTGTYGIYWNDTTATSESASVTICDSRFEQGNTAGGYALYLAPNHFSYNLDVRAVHSDYGANHHKGYFIRNFRSGVFDNNMYEGLGEGMNVDSSDGITVSNNFFNMNAGGTAVTSGFKGTWCNNDAAGFDIGTTKCSYNTGAPPTNQIAMPNNASLAGMNNTSSAEVQIAKVDSAFSHVAFAPAGTAAFTGGPLTVSADMAVGSNSKLVIPNGLSKCLSGENAAGTDAYRIGCIDTSNNIALAPQDASNHAYTTSPSWSFGGDVLTGNTIFHGSGNPNGSVTGIKGDIYLNDNGGAATTLYINEAGGTVWVAYVGGAGISQTMTVRNSAGSGTCTITATAGLITATTC